MHFIITIVALTALSVGSAKAILVTGPGAPLGGAGNTYTLLDDSLPQLSEQGSIRSTFLGVQPVTVGDVVLLERGLAPIFPNYSDVLHFYNDAAGAHVDLLSWDVWTGFTSFYQSRYGVAFNPAAATYIPETIVPGSEDPSYAGGNYTVYQAQAAPILGIPINTYNIESVAVPEASTYLAGALLLIPFSLKGIKAMSKRNRQ
jgi:hypothetical protein